MARNGDTLIEWAGEKRLFRLGWAELEGLQEACDCGPHFVLAHLQSATARVEYILEPLRWGLIGGGMSQADADALVEEGVKGKPWDLSNNLATALVVMLAALMGAEDEPPKKSKAAADAPPSREGK